MGKWSVFITCCPYVFASQIYLALRVFTTFKAIHLGWFLFFLYHLFYRSEGHCVFGNHSLIVNKKFSYFSLQILVFFSSLFYSYLNWVNPKGGHFVILSSWVINKSWSPPYPIHFSIRPKQMITCKFKKSFYFSIKVGLKNQLCHWRCY